MLIKSLDLGSYSLSVFYN